MTDMNEEIHCAMLIRQIHTELEKNANNELRRNDITYSQVTVLMELDRAAEGQMELKRLEKSLHVAQSTAAGIVHRMEQKHLVEGFGRADDRRIKMVRITEKGRACCADARVNMQRAEDSLTAALTDTEREILITLLQKVRDSF